MQTYTNGIKKTESTSVETLLKIEDIMQIFSCKRDKAYAIVHTSGFPKIQIGRQYYVPPTELQKWLKVNMNKTIL